MRYALIASLIMIATTTSDALAQDGAGHGPPKIVIIMPTPVPTPASQTVPLPKLVPPQQESASTTR